MSNEDVKLIQSIDVLARLLAVGKMDGPQQVQVIDKVLELVKKL